jgi:hypothetical protein
MQQIIIFLIKNSYKLLFLLLLGISLTLTIKSHSYHRSQYINSSNAFSGYTYSKINNVKELNSREFYNKLHEKLKEKIKELTGKPNKKMQINGKPTSFSFLCSPKDLYERMQILLKKYPEIDDPTIVEHVLLEHCQHNSPIIEYYILKTEHGITKSRLYTDYCSTDKDSLSPKKQINLTIYNK